MYAINSISTSNYSKFKVSNSSYKKSNINFQGGLKQVNFNKPQKNIWKTFTAGLLGVLVSLGFVESKEKKAMRGELLNLFNQRYAELGADPQGTSYPIERMTAAYIRNPELVKELMLKNYEYSLSEKHLPGKRACYSYAAICLIEEYSDKYPELTDLYKKCLSDSRDRSESRKESNEKMVLDLVTQNPKNVEKALYAAGFKDNNRYYSNESYSSDKMLEILKEMQ